MKPTMPVITLLAGAALGGGVLVASVLATSSTPSASSTGPSPAAAGNTGTLPSPGTSGTVVTLPSPGSPGTVVTLPPPGQPGTVVALPPSGSPGTVVALSSPGSSGAVVTQPPPSTSAPVVAQPPPSSSTAVVTQPPPSSSATVAAAPTVAATTSPATASPYVPADADYGAQAPGGDAAVAVSVHGNHAVAYVCDGHKVGQWFNGTAKAGTLNLAGSNGAHLTVSYRDTGAAGYVTADGQRYAFSAPALSGHRYGLYQSTAIVNGTKIKAGWIELPHGTPVGAVLAITDAAAPLVTPAPPLDLATGTAQYDGVVLVATLISGVTGSGF
jgi:hypothetical protein